MKVPPAEQPAVQPAERPALEPRPHERPPRRPNPYASPAKATRARARNARRTMNETPSGRGDPLAILLAMCASARFDKFMTALVTSSYQALADQVARKKLSNHPEWQAVNDNIARAGSARLGVRETILFLREVVKGGGGKLARRFQ